MPIITRPSGYSDVFLSQGDLGDVSLELNTENVIAIFYDRESIADPSPVEWVEHDTYWESAVCLANDPSLVMVVIDEQLDSQTYLAMVQESALSEDCFGLSASNAEWENILPLLGY